MTKKIIEVEECIPEEYTFDGCTLSQIRERINAMIEIYGDDAEWTIDSGYSNASETIFRDREETDVEYATRLKQEEAQKIIRLKADQKREAKERKEYERLRKKFGECGNE